METIDFADQGLPFLPPVNAVAPLKDDAPRCRRCAAVLVVAHLRCDDGGLVPIYRCPICRHEGAERHHLAVISRQQNVVNSETLQFAD